MATARRFGGDVGLHGCPVLCACMLPPVKRVRIMENPPTSGPTLITSLGNPSNGSINYREGWLGSCVSKITQLHVVNDID